MPQDSTRRSRRNKGRKAWLITWEWVGDHAKPNYEKVAAILNPRLAGRRVCERVEQLYVDSELSLQERIDYALDKKSVAYRAKLDTLNGVHCVHCGHNPFLLGRVVDDLRVERDKRGNEGAAWKEIGRRGVLTPASRTPVHGHPAAS